MESNDKDRGNEDTEGLRGRQAKIGKKVKKTEGRPVLRESYNSLADYIQKRLQNHVQDNLNGED